MSIRSKQILFYFLLYLILSLSFSILNGYRFYNSVFRISYNQVESELKDKDSLCTEFKKCKLLPGDIVIRRYITQTADLFDILNPYFTHSAFYLGNNELFEALGNYVKKEDQITISNLNKSDWMDEEMKNFIIFRPKNYSGKLEYTINELKRIANDEEYSFGPISDENKTVSCSDAIFKYLNDIGLFKNKIKQPQYIVPDYLFSMILKNPDNFDIVGYKIENQKIALSERLLSFRQIFYPRVVLFALKYKLI